MQELKAMNQEVKNKLPQAHAALHEAVDMLLDINDFFGQSFGLYNSSMSFADFKTLDDNIEILISVPEVENSETIKASFDDNKKQLEIIVPQQASLTNIFIDQNTIRKVSNQHSQQKYNDKTTRYFASTSSERSELEYLPFPVDPSSAPTIDYKDDILFIKLKRLKEKELQKAQPCTIQVTKK